MDFHGFSWVFMGFHGRSRRKRLSGVEGRHDKSTTCREAIAEQQRKRGGGENDGMGCSYGTAQEALWMKSNPSGRTLNPEDKKVKAWIARPMV